jgi:hypothetical protein
MSAPESTLSDEMIEVPDEAGDAGSDGTHASTGSWPALIVDDE